MKRAFVLVATLIATITVGCTAPGEPPAHPSVADYHDLVRRETAKSQSALATAQVVVNQLRRGRITKNYATVTARQADADITAVITDLHQITAPTPQLRRTQSSLQHVLTRASATIASIPPNWNHQPQLRQIARRLAIASSRQNHHSNTLD
jgi:hypothetical protein